MIDIHSHVLPGLDDGPARPEASLALARVAAADGTLTLAATPHARGDFPGVRIEDVGRRCDELRRMLQEEVSLSIVPGAEVDLVWALNATPDRLFAASYFQRGKDLLVETPVGPLPTHFEELVFRIAIQGFRVTLAHPERNVSFHRNPLRITNLVKNGVLIQVNAGSLAAGTRSRVGRFAFSLVGEGLAHVLASDAHSAGPWRPPILSAAVEAASSVISAEAAQWMVCDAPAAVLDGRPLPPRPHVTQPRRRRLRRKGS